MWFKVLTVLAGVACIADRLVNGADAWSTGLSPSGESIAYIVLGTVLILLGVLIPREVVRDVF